MAIGDIYQVICYWDNDGEDSLSVFFYELISGSDPNGALSAVEALYEDLIPSILAAMASLCILRKIEGVNLMDQSEFFVKSAIDDPGDVTVSASSQGATFDAWSVRFEKAFPGAPTGHKRFPGVAETITSRNLYVPSQPIIDAILSLISSLIGYSLLTNIFQPVIVKRPFSFAVPPTVWYDILQATWTNLTTQNSRKTVNPF